MLAKLLNDPTLSGSRRKQANLEVHSSKEKPAPWDISDITMARDVFLEHRLVVIRGYSKARWGGLEPLRAAWNSSSITARQSVNEKWVVRKNLARSNDNAPAPSRPREVNHLLTPESVLGEGGSAPAGSWYLSFFAVSERAPEFTARVNELLPDDAPAEPDFLHDAVAGNATTERRIWVFLGRHIAADGPEFDGVGEHIDKFNADGTWQLQVDGKKTWRVRRPGEDTTHVVTCHEGDMLVVDTSQWYHATRIAGTSRSRLVVSLARDFTLAKGRGRDEL